MTSQQYIFLQRVFCIRAQDWLSPLGKKYNIFVNKFFEFSILDMVSLKNIEVSISDNTVYIFYLFDKTPLKCCFEAFRLSSL